MDYKRIDALEINYPDSATYEKLKLSSTTATGEKRIYVGSNKDLLDDFFLKDEANRPIEYFFFLKNDLLEYILKAKNEYLNPKQEYRENIGNFYIDNLQKTRSIPKNVIKLNFKTKFDSGHRYYLVLERQYKKEYDYARNIMLPRITKLRFLKIEVKNKIYIYIKPIIQDILVNEQVQLPKIIDKKSPNKNVTQKEQRNAYLQAKYRRELFDKMPSCIFTCVTEDRILCACHIKPYSVCNENECFDVANGITMTPTYHELFDNGFISFDDNKRLLISPFLSNINRKRLNLIEKKAYPSLQSGSKNYLIYHRKNIFNKAPKFDDFI